MHSCKSCMSTSIGQTGEVHDERLSLVFKIVSTSILKKLDTSEDLLLHSSIMRDGKSLYRTRPLGYGIGRVRYSLSRQQSWRGLILVAYHWPSRGNYEIEHVILYCRFREVFCDPATVSAYHTTNLDLIRKLVRRRLQKKCNFEKKCWLLISKL